MGIAEDRELDPQLKCLRNAPTVHLVNNPVETR
jgi:hypothetical protein